MSSQLFKTLLALSFNRNSYNRSSIILFNHPHSTIFVRRVCIENFKNTILQTWSLALLDFLLKLYISQGIEVTQSYLLIQFFYQVVTNIGFYWICSQTVLWRLSTLRTSLISDIVLICLKGTFYLILSIDLISSRAN